MTFSAAPVVAGIDGSDQQQRVIDWAVTEARLRHRPLVLVHAYDWAILGPSFALPPYGSLQEALHHAAERVRDSARTAVRAAAPGLDAEVKVIDGHPVPVLLDAARHAALLVVGHRGRGGFAEMLTGSVAAQVSAHAVTPTIVLRPVEGEGTESKRVIVGVDGSSRSEAAVEFAFSEAAARGLGLTAVHAWQDPAATGWADLLPLVYDVTEVEEEESRLLSEALAGYVEKYPEIPVRRLLVRGGAAHALIHAAAGAALLVVGSRGTGGFPGLILGSTCRTVLHHTPCPVAIVHQPTTVDGTTAGRRRE